MRIVRGIVALAGMLLIALSLGVIVLAGPIEQAAKNRLETRLSYIFESHVSIGALHLKPLQRGAVLTDLIVSNPPGFHRVPAMHFRTIRFSFELQTLFSAKPVLDTVLLEDAEIHLRHEVGRGTNLVTLARSARTAADSDAGRKEAGRKLFIRELSSVRGKVHVGTNLVPIGQLPLDLSDFTIRDIGSGQPVSTSELVAIFTRSLIWEIVTFKGLLRPLADNLRDELDRLFPQQTSRAR
jgi:hypothetical protein